MIDFNNYAPTVTTTLLPWHCYAPDTLSRVVFTQTNLGEVELTEIPGATRPGEYVLASKLGQYIDNGKQFDWHDQKNRLDICNLLENMGCADIEATARAIYERDNTDFACQRFLRTRFEYAYITGLYAKTQKGKIHLAMGLRRYERLWGTAVREIQVHHILPQFDFPESAADIQNLVVLPITIHKELHDIVYTMINKGQSPRDAVCEWMWRTTASDVQLWMHTVASCAHAYSEAMRKRAPKWEFIR